MKDFNVISWEQLKESTDCFFPLGTGITIGGFDGPHAGHNVIFKKVLSQTKKLNLKAGVVTFIRSPEAGKRGARYIGDVSSLRLRLRKFYEFGFDFVILIDFSPDFAKMSGIAFVDVLIKTIRMRYLAVGADFCCGYRRGIGADELRKSAPHKGFCFDSVNQVCLNGMRISSTAVRNAVLQADFSLAKQLLGYPFLFDIIGPPWSVTGKTVMQTKREFLTQTIPHSGKYSVSVNMIDGTKLKAQFIAEEKSVILQLNDDGFENHICGQLNNFDTVEFL